MVPFVVELEGKRSVARRRAIEGFHQMADRPIPMPTPESEPETDPAMTNAPKFDVSVNTEPMVVRLRMPSRRGRSRWPWLDGLVGSADLRAPNAERSHLRNIMSETSKTAETASKATDTMARSNQAAIEEAGTATKGSIVETGQSIIETIAETADAAASMSTKAAAESREVLMFGMRAVAGVGGRVADISFGRGHHLMSSTAHVMTVYRDASERSAEQVQALLSSAMSLGRGLQRVQHAWLEMADHAMATAAHKPQDLLRCNNIVELAEVQRDLYLGAVNHAFEATSRLLDLAGRTVQEAVRPLQSPQH
jgi:hypothetical protein